MDEEIIPTLKLNRPAFYRDVNFLVSLSSGELATWHDGGEPDDFSDVFLTYDNGEGSNSDLPEWIWDDICQAAKKAGLKDCLVWITNLDWTPPQT